MKRTGIVAFAFGSAKTAGCRRIAAIASRRARWLHAPIYTQDDVPIGDDVGVEVTSVLDDDESGKPPPTLAIARGAARWAQKKGLERIMLVAAAPHCWRVEHDTRKALQEIDADIEIHVCPEPYRYPERAWFCPELKNEQLRVRSKLVWWLRETTLMLMPFWLYERVAG